MRIATVPRSRRRRIFVTTLVLGSAVVLTMLVRQPMAAFIEKQMTCLDLTGGDTRTRDVQFQDLAKPGELPGLDNALYQIEVDGYCYHTECNLDLRAPLT